MKDGCPKLFVTKGFNTVSIDMNLPQYPDAQDIFSQQLSHLTPSRFNYDPPISQEVCTTSPGTLHAQATPYKMKSLVLQADPNFSTISGLVVPSAVGSPYSIQRHIVGAPECLSNGPGLNGGIEDLDDFDTRGNYNFGPAGMEDFALEPFKPAKYDSFVSEYKFITKSTSHWYHSILFT
jgi:hypothetical protein